MSSGPFCLVSKINKNFEANEGGPVWRDSKARHFDCIVQMISVVPIRDAWEENYADFKACDGMPVKGTKEYN